MFTRSLRAGFLGLIVLAASAWAAPATLEGTIKDANGQPLKGADVRIEARQGSKLSKIVKTDAKGHYVSDPLSAGDYRVTLLVNGATKASIGNTTVKAGEATKLNFSLAATGAQKSTKKGTHMVYVPGETGSHISGRWVEVDDNAVTNTAGADNVKKVDGSAISKMQAGGGTMNAGGR
jgi:uncharacterized surface anchored protein